MQDNLEMIVHPLFDGDITIYPISDVHYGALEHCAAEWKSFCKKIESEPNSYLILNGDLINNSVRSCSFANPFNEVVRPREQKREMMEFLKPVRDKILCIVSGNHERRTEKDVDQDLTYDIAAKLDIEHLYRRDIAFMKIGCGQRNTENKPKAAYSFAVTHGAGGGIYTGATVNRNERFGNVIDGLDCLIVGHTHKGTVSKPSKIVFDPHNNIVKVQSYVVISCVSWLNYGGYPMQKMLLPAEVAKPQRLLLSASRDKQIEVRW